MGFFGFLKSAAKKIGSTVASGAKTLGASAVKHVIPTPVMALYDFIARQPLLKHFSASSQAFLNRCGNGVITHIQISRTLIQAPMHSLLNLITIGKWNEARNDLKFDKLYHLFMIISYKLNGRINQVILEKNERPQFVQANARGGEMINVPVDSNLTITDFCDNAIKRVGVSRYFVYDAFNRTNAGGNCQRFVDDNLSSSRGVRYISTMREFVMQSVDELIKRLPDYTGNVAQAVTNFFSKLKTGFLG